MNITVLYSCNGCGLKRAEVSAPIRQPDQDLMKWMDTLGICLAQDHAKRSPDCTAHSCSDVMIPINGAQYVGGPAVN